MGTYGLPAPKGIYRRKKRDKLRDRLENWREVRRAVLIRDHRHCRVCHTGDDIDVHHIRFKSVGGKDSTANCACLCRVCHSDVHAYRLTLEGNANEKLKITRIKVVP